MPLWMVLQALHDILGQSIGHNPIALKLSLTQAMHSLHVLKETSTKMLVNVGTSVSGVENVLIGIN